MQCQPVRMIRPWQVVSPQPASRAAPASPCRAPPPAAARGSPATGRATLPAAAAGWPAADVRCPDPPPGVVRRCVRARRRRPHRWVLPRPGPHRLRRPPAARRWRAATQTHRAATHPADQPSTTAPATASACVRAAAPAWVRHRHGVGRRGARRRSRPRTAPDRPPADCAVPAMGRAAAPGGTTAPRPASSYRSAR